MESTTEPLIKGDCTANFYLAGRLTNTDVPWQNDFIHYKIFI